MNKNAIIILCIVLVVAVIIFLFIFLLIKSIKFRNIIIKMKNEIELKKSNVRIHKEKYISILKNVASSHEKASESSGNYIRNFNSLGFIADYSNKDDYSSSINMVRNEAQELIDSQKELNTEIKRYNNYISTFPNNIMACVFKFKKEKFIDEMNLDNSLEIGDL